MHVTHDTARIAAALAGGGLILIACFQIALALGVGWGRAAWGGAHIVLPPRLRLASGAAAPVLIAAALIVLGRVDYWGAILPFAIFRWGMWVLVAVFALNTLGNFASPSRWERQLMGPLTLLLTLLCIVVGLSDRR